MIILNETILKHQNYETLIRSNNNRRNFINYKHVQNAVSCRIYLRVLTALSISLQTPRKDGGMETTPLETIATR